jgi:hypothetical protein
MDLFSNDAKFDSKFFYIERMISDFYLVYLIFL